MAPGMGFSSTNATPFSPSSSESGALLPAAGILAAVHGDHQDFSALFSKVVRLKAD